VLPPVPVELIDELLIPVDTVHIATYDLTPAVLTALWRQKPYHQ
jgi:hypothetical protein